MELRHLRYFLAVAEAENVSRAALKLHLSQPALSRQIRDLEEELGFLLLERSAKSVRLTDAGRVFLEETRAVLQRVEAAVKSARAIASGDRGELHVGYAPTLTARILPPALRAFQAGNPGVRVKLHDLSTDEMLVGLRERRLQLAYMVRQAPAELRGLRFVEVTRDPLRLAVAPGHRLARKRAVTLAEASREPFVVYSRKDYPDYHGMLASLFPFAAFRLQIAEEHDGASSLISAVEAGNGVALVSLSFGCLAGPRMKLIPFSPAPQPLIVGLVLPADKTAPLVESFVRCAQLIVSSK
jgi:DNA-binding transcriptional LysR family regulator